MAYFLEISCMCFKYVYSRGAAYAGFTIHQRKTLVIKFPSHAIYEHEQMSNGLNDCIPHFVASLPTEWSVQPEHKLELVAERRVEEREAEMLGFIVFKP